MAAHPAARVRTLAELHEAIAGCRMCPNVTPPPILWAREGQRALIIGQAPGITEPLRGLPFAGAAGRKLVSWLAPLGITDHEEMLERFAFASVAKCYPGRLPGGRATARPTAASASAAGPGRTPSCGSAIPRSSCPSAVSRSTTGSAPRPRRGRGQALRARRPRDRAAPPPLRRERLDERRGQPRARRARRRTAARHAPLTARHEGVTAAGPSVSGRGTRPGDGRDGSPLGTARAAAPDRCRPCSAPASQTGSSTRSGELPHARRASRSTPDERALRNPRLRALIDRALPHLVLERDATGDDDEVPVWTSCRHPLCARAGRAAPVLHVHVVHTAAGPVVELWTYYPDSQTSHLPIAALRG